MATIKPFKALRPKPELAKQVASRPYDVLTSEEAREEAKNNPHSFLHLTKSEIDLPVTIDTHSHTVYQKAKENLQQFIHDGILFAEEKACYYIYQLVMPARAGTDGNDEVGQGRWLQPSSEEQASRNAKEQILYTGFIAQEVETAAKELNYDFSGVDRPQNENALYGLRYAEFVVPLVKAVQELSEKNDELNLKMEQFENLKMENEQLRSRLELIEQRLGISSSVQISSASLTGAGIEQNIPNPFNHTTTINYNLPKSFSSAKIIVTDKTGKVLKEVNLSGSGRGHLNVDASMLASGAYQYSLYVDGRLIDAKQMMLAK